MSLTPQAATHARIVQLSRVRKVSFFPSSRNTRWVQEIADFTKNKRCYIKDFRKIHKCKDVFQFKIIGVTKVPSSGQLSLFSGRKCVQKPSLDFDSRCQPGLPVQATVSEILSRSELTKQMACTEKLSDVPPKRGFNVVRALLRHAHSWKLETRDNDRRWSRRLTLSVTSLYFQFYSIWLFCSTNPIFPVQWIWRLPAIIFM